MSEYGWHCLKVMVVGGTFMALVAAACWWTRSAWVLWALLLFPSFEFRGNSDVT